MQKALAMPRNVQRDPTGQRRSKDAVDSQAVDGSLISLESGPLIEPTKVPMYSSVCSNTNISRPLEDQL